MPPDSWYLSLNQTQSTIWVLASIAGVIALIALLFAIGWLDLFLGFVGRVLEKTIQRGFRFWERTLWWTRWPSYLLLVSLLLGFGIHSLTVGREWVSLPISVALLSAGISTCLAFMQVSIERYEVTRGYKAVHKPAKGQELAHHVVRYGDRLGPLMLAISAAAGIAGFSLLNESLYYTFGESWYILREAGVNPTYLDFLVFTLINLLRVVDVLDLFRSSHLLSISFVRQGAWPVTVLLTAFKSMFTLVLVQQILASLRQQRLIWEMVADFWSPHAPIHQRAHGALTQFGHLAVAPLMRSLADAETLNKEQRDELPRVLADIGPLAIPHLMTHLNDERDTARGVATVALGHLQAVEAIPALAGLCRDPNETIRACAVEALGSIGAAFAPYSMQPASANGRRAKSQRRFAVIMMAGKLSAAGLLVCWRVCGLAFGRRDRRRYQRDADPVATCVDALVSTLADPSTAVRSQAISSLGRIGPRADSACRPLLSILKTGNDQERTLAAEACGKFGAAATSAIPALSEATRDASSAVRAAAAFSLGQFREEAADTVAALVALLDDPIDAVRNAATVAIAQIGVLDVEASKALAEKLAHPDNLRRAQTAEALGEMGEAAQPAAPALVDSLTDDNDLVRSKAAEALGRIGEGTAELAVPALTKSLYDDDNAVRVMAVGALGQMGPHAALAVPDLIELLQSGNSEVRTGAAEALGQIRAPESRPALEAACRDENVDFRAQAVKALGALGTATASTRQILVEMLGDTMPQVRAEAAESMAVFDSWDESILLAVSRLLDDECTDVALRFMRVLPRFGSAILPFVLENLCRKLSEEAHPGIQATAAEALGRFGALAAAAGKGLAHASQTGDATVRSTAMTALCRILPPEAAAAFAAGLHDAEVNVRKHASAGLTRITELSEPAGADLLEAMSDPEILVRMNAAAALAKFASLPPEAEPLLLTCTASPHTGLRRYAAAALGRIDSANSRQALQGLIHDPNAGVRKTAESALSLLEPPSVPANGEDDAEMSVRLLQREDASNELCELVVGPDAAPSEV